MYFNYKQSQNKIKLEVASDLSSKKQILCLCKSPPSISNFCGLPMIITNYSTLRPFKVQMSESSSFHK